MKPKLKVWLRAYLGNINGFFVSIGAMAAISQDFNLRAGFKRFMIMAVFSGIISAVNYLKQSPLPGDKLNK